MGQYNWVKLWVKDWLEGSISKEDVDVRGVLATLIAYAGKVERDGRIELIEGVGLSDEQIAKVLNIPIEVWEKAKKKLKKEEITIEKGGVIKLKKWKKYQVVSEYERQKPYRQRKREEAEVVTEVTDEDTGSGYKASYKTDIDGDVDKEEDKDKKREKDSRIKRLTDYHSKEFFRIHGKKPKINYGQAGKLLKQLLKDHTEEEIQELHDLFISGETGDNFIDNEVTCSLGVFCSEAVFNKLLLLKGKENKRREEVEKWKEKQKKILEGS